MTDVSPVDSENFDVAVIGGGPAGSTAARTLAQQGRKVVLIDRDDRIKPCGGIIPAAVQRIYDVPDTVVTHHVDRAKMVAPSGREVVMKTQFGDVGMVDRKDFDPWLRDRAANDGATYIRATVKTVQRDEEGRLVVSYLPKDAAAHTPVSTLRARVIIGADGASSRIARQELPNEQVPLCPAYHEIVATPEGFDTGLCQLWYQARISPDFFGWVFPHGDTISVGTASAVKGFSLKDATALLREVTGLKDTPTLRCEGAPLPLFPRKVWDNGRDVLLVGDAAGCAASSSGEGIFFAMDSGRFGAEAVGRFLDTGDAMALKDARKAFFQAHGKAFWIMEKTQHFWYKSDKRRELFVKRCADPDLQHLVWDSFQNKKKRGGTFMGAVRIFLRNIAHILRLDRKKET